ncbi:MAG TPA: VWA domain-containing protein [Chloroflexota bacterium]|jgi:uncharacterized membrane protein|nr:VWA domain-containing protein [Chloroflexota bacterium]
MISFTTPVALVLIVPLFAAAILFWRGGFVNLSPGRARLALAVRLALLGLIVLGLAGMSVDLGQSRQAVAIVADLSASDARDSTQMQGFINRAAEQRSGGNLVGVVDVGRDAKVEQPVSSLSSFDGFQTQIDPNYTNLAGGLLLANAILPAGYQHRITLITDGNENAGDALSAARLLRSLHVRVDVMPVHVASGPEVMVDSVTMPSHLRPKEQFALTVTVRSNVRTSLQLTIYHDQTLAISRREQVRPGENQFVFNQPPLNTGFHTYQVHIDPALDTLAENNVGSAFAIVSGRPTVLVISPSEVQAANVLTSLRTTGIAATFEQPAAVVPSLAYLQRFAAVVLIDTPVEALDPQVVDDLVPYVRDLGHGLVVIGGTETYGMGGYGQTGLEQALPVSMNLPKRRDLPSAAVVLIIEDLESGSQVNISKVAGKGVVALMSQQDQIAVNDSNGGQFPVPLQHVVNKGAIDQAIDNMSPSDPMSYLPDLQASFNLLKNANATVKHIILLGDGDATDSGYESVVKKIRAAGITVSTVASNGMGYSDLSTMQTIASWGGGKFYNANDPNAIPTIFLREARTFARSGIIAGRFYPELLSENPMIKDLHGMPDLTGYVATTPKPAGEMILVSKKLDPVLAGWQYGLGRSVAWTSDASGLWTKDWLRAPGGNRFWANLVSWSLPASNGGRLAVNAAASQGQGTVSVNVPPSLGPNATVTAHILGPDLHAFNIQLQPTAPGYFQGSFAANSPGAYFVSAEARGSGHAQVGSAGVDMPYSAEYRTAGSNTPFIQSLAAAGGGSVVTKPSSVWQGNLASVSARQSLSIWLWLLALLLLPIDVAVRRLIVGRRDLQNILRAVPGFARPAPSLVPAVAPLGTIRQQRSSGGIGSLSRRSRGSTQSSPSVSQATIHVSDATRPGSRRRQGPTESSPSVSQTAVHVSNAIRPGPAGTPSSRAKPSAGTKGSTKSPPPAASAAASSAEQPPDKSTASQLLASRRRRKS